MKLKKVENHIDVFGHHYCYVNKNDQLHGKITFLHDDGNIRGYAQAFNQQHTSISKKYTIRGFLIKIVTWKNDMRNGTRIGFNT